MIRIGILTGEVYMFLGWYKLILSIKKISQNSIQNIHQFIERCTCIIIKALIRCLLRKRGKCGGERGGSEEKLTGES